VAEVEHKQKKRIKALALMEKESAKTEAKMERVATMGEEKNKKGKQT
jgi:hypothetical protein